ncbi:MAG: glycosyltransferase [Candidatus Paracaedibacteraceae bacterium]|nr:glycosyltransferase [Candidatus Paracaedibacteraceae bacterium]
MKSLYLYTMLLSFLLFNDIVAIAHDEAENDVAFNLPALDRAVSTDATSPDLIIPNMSNENFIKDCMPDNYRIFSNSPPGDYSKVLMERAFNMDIQDSVETLNNFHKKAIHTINSPIVNSKADMIPQITHKLWLTNPGKPHPVPNQALKGLKQTYLNLPGYKHIFWTNFPDGLKDTFKELEDAGIEFEVHHTDELLLLPCSRLFTVFMKHKLYAFAGNIIRIQALYKYGGIYSDLGWLLSKNMPQIVQKFDFVAHNVIWSGNRGQIDHNLMASKPSDNVLGAILKKVDDDAFFNTYLYTSLYANNIWEVQELVTPVMLNAAFSALANSDTKLLLLNAGEHTFLEEHLNSWHPGNFAYNGQSFEKCNMVKFVNDYKALTSSSTNASVQNK